MISPLKFKQRPVTGIFLARNWRNDGNHTNNTQTVPSYENSSKGKEKLPITKTFVHCATIFECGMFRNADIYFLYIIPCLKNLKRIGVEGSVGHQSTPSPVRFSLNLQNLWGERRRKGGREGEKEVCVCVCVCERTK